VQRLRCSSAHPAAAAAAAADGGAGDAVTSQYGAAAFNQLSTNIIGAKRHHITEL